MKVIHYIESIDKTGGGTTEYMRLLSKALKKDISFSIATGFSTDPIVIDGVRIKYFNTKTIRWFTLLQEFEKYLHDERPDIVHINGIWNPPNWGFQKMAQQQGIKVIISPHGMLEPWILAHNSWKKNIALFLYQKKALEQADLIHATASMEAKNIKDCGISSPIEIIPNGVDISDVKEIKSVYGTQKIVFISRIHPKKGIELLIKAWRNCNTTGWILEIAGNGDKNYIANLTESALDLNNLQFVGSKYGNAKWEFIRSADVMVLPTHSENFGIVIAKSLAMGVPVITTQGTPWSDLEKYNCGWWINLSVANLEIIIKKIIITDRTKLKNMGIRGRNLILDKYEITEISKLFLNLYKTILN
jgi:glycosyltransferase involved in cell wall biosynthesis